MGLITSADSVFVLTVPGVFSATQLQGYATDDAFTLGEAESAEVYKGVDGRQSAGFVPYITEMTIHFQADSASAVLFEQWDEAEKAALTKYPASASVSLPAIQRKYAMTNGILRRLVKMPTAGKTLRPRTFTLAWEDVSPAIFG